MVNQLWPAKQNRPHSQLVAFHLRQEALESHERLRQRNGRL